MKTRLRRPAPGGKLFAMNCADPHLEGAGLFDIGPEGIVAAASIVSTLFIVCKKSVIIFKIFHFISKMKLK